MPMYFATNYSSDKTTRTEIRELLDKVSIVSHLRKKCENLTLEIYIKEEKREKNETQCPKANETESVHFCILKQKSDSLLCILASSPR